MPTTDQPATTRGPQTGAQMIATERRRQVEQKGHTTAIDMAHNDAETLALAAVCYATPTAARADLLGPGHVPDLWPWPAPTYKPIPDDRVRELVKAGALLAAEIDRLLAERHRAACDMAVRLSYDSLEHTPLQVVLQDVARYQGVVDLSTHARPTASYVVLAVDPDAVTVQPWCERTGTGAGEPVSLPLRDITRLHVY